MAKVTKSNIPSFLLTALLLSFNTPASFAQQKHALLVGVGDHIMPKASLKGPKNDIPALQQLLIEKYNFRSENIEVLQDRNATKNNIIRAFERRLISTVRPGDLVFFYYSGHGTQIPDRNGDESDGLDEALVPYDAQSIETLLSDDELRKLIQQIPTREVAVVIDACHSGTGTRGAGVKARYISPRKLGIRGITVKPAQGGKDNLSNELTGPTIISAARSDQKAADYPFFRNQMSANAKSNPYMGALTYYLLEQMRLDRESQLSFAALTRKVRASLARKGFDQVPQVEGYPRKRFLMFPGEVVGQHTQMAGRNIPSSATFPAVEVVKVRANEVTLKAIGGSQLVAGSLFESINKRDMFVDNDSPQLVPNNEPATVQLLVANGQTGLGRLLKGRVEPEDRLTEIFRFIPRPKLRVAILGDTHSKQQLSQGLAASQYIQLVTEDEFRDAELEIERSASGTIYITPYRNQQSLPTISTRNVNDAVRKIAGLLENLYAVKLLTDLSNPNPPFILDLQVNGKDYDEVSIGSEVSFTVRSNRDVYLYLVDVDPAGKVTVLFPNVHVPNNFLKADRIYNMPAPNLYRLEVSGPAGPEIVKAIATVQPLQLEIFNNDAGDFSGLGGKTARIARTIFDQLKREVNRTSSRGITVLPAGAKDQPISTEGWATDDVLILVVE